ncbi:MAG: N-acyl-D-amino-acid deacylase family protein [Candidatus Polarisedimenticolia bacterium]
MVVRGERVEALLEPGAGAPEAEVVLDAAGLVVSPGFIDLHSHGELAHALPPSAQRALIEGRLAQGITTEIVGNCGLGAYPCASGALDLLRPIVDWMTPPQAAGWPGGAWDDLGGYLDHLERQGTWVNVGSLQPHGPLRLAAAGLRREAGPPERRAMAALLRRALDAGAFGLSTGLIYPPGMYAPPDELVELAREAAAAGGPAILVASHIRGSSETLLPAVRELLDLGRAAGVRVQHSHNEAVGRGHWPKVEAVLSMEEGARARGVDIAHDVFPYTAAATMMLAIYPPWSLEGGVHRLLERLADPAQRSAIREAIDTVEPSWPAWTPQGWPHNLVRAVGWDQITIGSVGSAHRDLEAMSLAELGRARGRAPFDAISDLMIEERGRVSQIIHGISGDDVHREGLDALLSDRAAAVCTDANDHGKGKPHPAAYGAFPRVLGWVRERRLMPLEEAIRKMTSWPAARLGLKDRGVVAPGAWADLVVLDDGGIGSSATYEDPRRMASGVRWVIVNGAIAWDSAHPTDARHPGAGDLPSGRVPSGRVLRRGD